jgi:lipoate-protein ligase A
MLKGKSKITAALIIGLTLGSSAVVNASTLLDATTVNTSTQADQKMHECNGGRGAVYKVLRDKLGFSNMDIENAAKSRKTAFDLAKTKGYTSDQLRNIVIDEHTRKLEEDVQSGKITKENADKMKADFNAKIQKWDGSLKHNEKHGKKHKAVYSVLKNKLGYSDSDVEKAAKEGKSAFDLAGAKKVTPDQFKEMVIEEQSKYIDEAVSHGKLTKEEGESKKAKVKTNMQNWNGSLQHKESNSKNK